MDAAYLSGVAVLGIVGVESDVVTTWEGRTSDSGGNPNGKGGDTDNIEWCRYRKD